MGGPFVMPTGVVVAFVGRKKMASLAAAGRKRAQKSGGSGSY